jgi:molybdopterin synthase catalytic subunit
MIVVQEQVFSSASYLEQLEAEAKDMGAVVSFTGKMRGQGETGADLDALYLEHYPGMTQQALRNIVQQAKSQFKVEEIYLIHRIGRIELDEPIVFVGAIGKHRKEAFDACMMVMDFLKNDAPFWKKEIYQDGAQVWVAQKKTDRDAKTKWQ